MSQPAGTSEPQHAAWEGSPETAASVRGAGTWLCTPAQPLNQRSFLYCLGPPGLPEQCAPWPQHRDTFCLDPSCNGCPLPMPGPCRCSPRRWRCLAACCREMGKWRGVNPAEAAQKLWDGTGEDEAQAAPLGARILTGMKGHAWLSAGTGLPSILHLVRTKAPEVQGVGDSSSPRDLAGKWFST